MAADRTSVQARIIRPGVGGFAPLSVLRRRTYLRVLPLPFGRALIVGDPWQRSHQKQAPQRAEEAA